MVYEYSESAAHAKLFTQILITICVNSFSLVFLNLVQYDCIYLYPSSMSEET